MGETIFYRDIDLSFERNPITGDLATKLNLNAINQSIYNLLMMRKFDEKFHPEINGGISQYLFENFTPLTEISLTNMIRTVLGNFEPRIRVTDVLLRDDVERNALEINIHYVVLSTGLSTSYKFYAYRQR